MRNIKGVGPVLADTIVKRRQMLPFTATGLDSQLQNLKGVGAAKVACMLHSLRAAAAKQGMRTQVTQQQRTQRQQRDEMRQLATAEAARSPLVCGHCIRLWSLIGKCKPAGRRFSQVGLVSHLKTKHKGTNGPDATQEEIRSSMVNRLGELSEKRSNYRGYRCSDCSLHFTKWEECITHLKRTGHMGMSRQVKKEGRKRLKQRCSISGQPPPTLDH